MITKKDIIGLAEIIKQHRGQDAGEPYKTRVAIEVTISFLAGDIATFIGRDNPRFDRDRFLKACGVNEK